MSPVSWIDSRREPQGETLYQALSQRFNWNFGPRLDQNFGGPDDYLFRLIAALDGELAWTVWDSLDDYQYIADSNCPECIPISATTCLSRA